MRRRPAYHAQHAQQRHLGTHRRPPASDEGSTPTYGAMSAARNQDAPPAPQQRAEPGESPLARKRDSPVGMLTPSDTN